MEEIRMTELKCHANTCCHNQEECCCKSTINVSGSQACCEDDTCCGSFQEKKEGSVSNSLKKAKHAIQITCDATDCKHNKECTCRATTIEVSGRGASSAKQTACDSFQAS